MASFWGVSVLKATITREAERLFVVFATYTGLMNKTPYTNNNPSMLQLWFSGSLPKPRYGRPFISSQNGVVAKEVSLNCNNEDLYPIDYSVWLPI